MVTWVQSTFSDSDGFLVSGEVELQVDSHAIVGQGVDIDIDVNTPSYVRQLKIGDFVTLKAASEYLSGVEYDEVVDLDWPYDQVWDHQPTVSYDTHNAEPPPPDEPLAPATETFWETSIMGSGTQTLEWEPEEGNFWFVVMNADGSSDVDVDMQIGARIPFLRYIGNMLLAGGFISLVVGGLIIYVGVFRRR
jgi:hypothetical protein